MKKRYARLQPKKNLLSECIALFDGYLKNQKGLSERYRYHVCNIARLFLYTLFGSKTIRFNQINQSDINHFIYSYAAHGSPYRTRNMASALRSFLRFLKFMNMISIDFSSIIPPVAVWKMDRIPDFLSSQEVTAMLKQCEKQTSVGLRDFTILRLLLNLGLRASEVATLTLDDLDWSNGEVLVRGKGSKIVRLPLTQALGEDLVAYLLKARPACASRNFFLSAKKPFHGLRGRAISAIVGAALKKADLRKKGKAHLLRHTLATTLLNQGATLQEVGGILRHQSIDTTVIYTKVDFKKLQFLALPWPGNTNFGGRS